MKKATREKVSLAEHLRSIVLLKAPLDDCVSALWTRWSRFGPTGVIPCPDWKTAKLFLLPLKSFTTRVLAIPYASTTILVKDRYGESAFVEGLAVSRLLKAEVLGGHLEEERRIIQYAESGKEVRTIAYYTEDDAWVYVDEGQPLACEARIGLQKGSLTLAQAIAVVGTKMGVEWPPPWRDVQGAVGVTRSLSTLEVPVLAFTTVDDL